MLRMKAGLYACSLAALFLAPASSAAAQQTTDNPQCTPNPVFSKFPGSYYNICEQSRFTTLELDVAQDPARPSGPTERVTKEGEYWYYMDLIPEVAGRSLPSWLELQRNFENAVRQAGGTVLATREYRGAVHYRVAKDGGEYWGFAECGGGDKNECNMLHHKIVRVAAMEQSVVVSAEQIAKDMAEGGKVVFYGIYFDTDQATLKPESAPTLAEMAKWLQANASARVYIVGHTDMQGTQEHNLKLSRDRAASVVAALTGEHGIARDRLVPDGVGPLAPVASNSTEAGRAKNRRVEMVLR